MARNSLDYLFDLSMKGVLKENLLLSTHSEPSNGGFWMMTPHEGDWKRVVEIIGAKEKLGRTLPYPQWDEIQGWGHSFEEHGDSFQYANGSNGTKWNFHGSFADQG
jgi:hypothetical protein